MQAWPEDPQRAPQVIERPPVWVTSAPIPVRQGQLVQIRGWAKVPRPVAGTSEGLLIFDSLGGPDLGDRIRLTRGWREFTLYRAVPQNDELTITFALTGLGEAKVSMRDTVEVSRLTERCTRALVPNVPLVIAVERDDGAHQRRVRIVRIGAVGGFELLQRLLRLARLVKHRRKH